MTIKKFIFIHPLHHCNEEHYGNRMIFLKNLNKSLLFPHNSSVISSKPSHLLSCWKWPNSFQLSKIKVLFRISVKCHFSPPTVVNSANSHLSLWNLLLFLHFCNWFSRCKEPTPLKSPWCWERLKAEGEEGIRGWDGWMASPMQWTWTWANFERW